MLLNCVVLLTVVAATIHDDRLAVFQSAAQMLPQELEDRIWGYYLDLVYGVHPQSPILSLEETQALFPILYIDLDRSFAHWDGAEGAEYISRTPVILPEDRYLTLHVTDDILNQDTLRLSIRFAENCESVGGQYALDNEDGTLYKSKSYEYYVAHGSLAVIKKQELNTDLEPGAGLLLHIPRGCTMTLHRAARRFFVRAQDEQFLPETILVSDPIPSVCRITRGFLKSYNGLALKKLSFPRIPPPFIIMHLLFLLLVVVKATIHDDRRVAFELRFFLKNWKN